MDIRYPATVEAQGDGGFLVQFVDLPDTFTEGKSKEEAIFNASEVLSAMLAWRLDESKDVPAPSQNLTNVQYIAPDAKTQANARCQSWLARSKRHGLRPNVLKIQRIGHP